MGLMDRLRALFRRNEPATPRTLRNKKHGMAWINARAAAYPGAEVLVGRAVRTVSLKEHGMWRVDPPQSYVVTAPTTTHGGRVAHPGATVQVDAISDMLLDPWRDDCGGVSEAEVLRLYSPEKKRLPA